MSNPVNITVIDKPIAESLLLTISNQSAFIVDFGDVDLVKKAGKWIPAMGTYVVDGANDKYGKRITVARLILSQYEPIGKLDVIEHLNGNLRDCRLGNLHLRPRKGNELIGGEAKERVSAKIFRSDAIWLESLPGNISDHIRQAVQRYKENYQEN
jgi:hypothetical protein